jgi:hypothetical protein
MPRGPSLVAHDSFGVRCELGLAQTLPELVHIIMVRLLTTSLISFAVPIFFSSHWQI